MMMMPTALVKPTMTPFEMKLTSTPRRKKPIASISTPDISDSVSAIEIKVGEPGTASGVSAVSTISDTALVGPDTACSEDPNRAATAVGTIAQ